MPRQRPSVVVEEIRSETEKKGNSRNNNAEYIKNTKNTFLRTYKERKKERKRGRNLHKSVKKG